ncbi:phage minor capsid protein [Streptomyces litchfieldiae]|uniref:Phage minor capsid protein n=1 Tax=Streptomyces litchfieldiae TaxID=3075543 RepID=A0ABU2MZG9_9ACTN|nr:phage minor capsid protein [Streptomyces sp. DSM 44938]MDT0346767.1 phage minor capsid protein [Streptomyces sp. DSM 44938]
MPIHPGMVEDLSAGVATLYADAEQRLLAVVARQLADGLDAPGWAVNKLRDIAPLRRAAAGIVEALATATELEVFDVVAEAFNTGARAGVAELGALADDDARRIAETTPNTRAVDRLAMETVQLVTATHRGILRGVEDGYRQVVAESSATPLLGIDTRRQATQAAMSRFADRGLRTFVDISGRAWQMTSYAEMATRTAVGRAAVEGHADRLRAAGLSLVIVSNAPHECPLCRPFEGEVLALDGPGGARTIEAEHATEDGRTVEVRIAGSVEEARQRGFQHPNCRHSLSAYLPGVTTRPVEHSSDPDGYEATQRQRAIERGIRRWKNRAAASLTPEGRRAAEARVRDWQGKMRDHLAEHPELIRRRERERIGAGNLPSTAPPPPTEAIQAARVRASDAQTLREMSDEHLAAATRPGALDERDLDRIAGEADRRDTAALLDRIRPGGALAEDLTPFSDDELAAVFPHLNDGELLRAMTELDRRDLDAGMPGARRDLIGMSDAQLAERAREHARRGNDAELAAIAAEADRRQLLAEVFPGGQLAANLAELGDEVLGWAVRYATPDQAGRIAAEFDRRYPPDPPPAATPSTPPPTPPGTPGAPTVAGLLDDRAALDEQLAPMPDPDGWGYWALSEEEARERDRFAGMSAIERRLAEQEEAQQSAQAAYTRAQIRQMYEDHIYRQYLAAEDELRGELLSRRAEADGVDPMSLFSGPAHIAYARASEELQRWWQDNPRVTLVEFTEQVTGQASSAAETARRSRNQQNYRL